MVGLADEKALSSVLAGVENQKLRLTIGKETITGTVKNAGVGPDEKATLQRLAAYPWYWRLVPFSSVTIGALRDEPVQVDVNKTVTEKYAAKIKDICSVPAKDAMLKVTGETVELDAAKSGTACPTDSIVRQLDRQTIGKDGLEYKLQLTTIAPKRTDKDVAPLLTTAKAIVAKPLTVTVAGKTYQVPKATVADWLMFVEKDDKSLVIDASAEKMKKYFETIQKDVYSAPGVTHITTRDGVEVSRVAGAAGRGIDGDKSAESIKQALLAKTGTAELTVAALPPILQYSRSYSNTPEGLQALVNDLSQANGGMAISVRKLGDSGVSANGDEQYHPASTYKLFVAYSVLKRIDRGEWTWDKPTSNGSVATCLDRMIINSDNPCAEWFGGTIGWSTVFGEVRAHGRIGRAASGLDRMGRQRRLPDSLRRRCDHRRGRGYVLLHEGRVRDLQAARCRLDQLRKRRWIEWHVSRPRQIMEDPRQAGQGGEQRRMDQARAQPHPSLRAVPDRQPVHSGARRAVSIDL
jgi:beta-lactamase class A